MIKNVQSLKDRTKNYARKNNLKVDQVLRAYMFERFLERVSKSKYKNKFIIKGGVLLSSIIGLNVRTTMDIDADLTSVKFNRDEVEKTINEILNIEIDDFTSINVLDIGNIRKDSEYVGFRVKLLGKAFNIKIPFSIDISTGDIITPGEIEYKYKMILEDDYINLYSYNMETIIAEKLHAILSKECEKIVG